MLLLSALCWAAAAQATLLRISCGSVGQELEMCKQSAETWAARTGNEVQVVAPPSDSNDRLALYQLILGSQSDKVDVYQIDVVWPGILANQLLDLKPFTHGVEGQHFAGIVGNNSVGGRLVAMPWFTDAGLLFYRKDLLAKYGQKLPTTWDELAAVARRVQEAERLSGNDRMWGYVWQGRAYEGLTCDALEWFASSGAGTIVDAGGKVSVNNPRARGALERARSWIGGISPAAVLNFGEEESRGVFQAGNAVFMRNWPYAWSLTQAGQSLVQGKVGVAVLPRDGADDRSAATLGGQQLAVSRYSRHPALAADFVMYMTSAAVQKQRAVKGSFYPTVAALYHDKEVLAANPFMGELYGVLASAVLRPTSVTGARYNEVSQAIWNNVHAVIAGRWSAAAGLARLEEDLDRLGRGGKWN